MSDVTKQKVYDEAKKWSADAEQSLDGLIAAITEHRTDEAKSEPEPAADPTPEPEPDAAA